MLTRDLSVTILGNTGVGKTTLIHRLTGEDIEDISPTTSIEVHQKAIRLKSQSYKSAFSIEKYRTYRVRAIDCPGDMSLWPYWKKALVDYNTNGIIFMIDPFKNFHLEFFSNKQLNHTHAGNALLKECIDFCYSGPELPESFPCHCAKK